MDKGRGSVVVRAVAVLVAGGLLAGASLVGPATGRPGFTKGKAKRIFYTKVQSDARFLNDAAEGVVAWAYVNGAGDVVQSKNIADASFNNSTTPKAYCLDVTVPIRSAQVTLDTINPWFGTAVLGDPGNSFCTGAGAATGDATVYLFDHAGTSISGNFFVLFT
jgi:hypothetical protein